MKIPYEFNNAQMAFEYWYKELHNAPKCQNTRALSNVGFTILNPTDRLILTKWRKWSNKYAYREWLWYLSEDRDVRPLAKYAPIWDRMHNGDGIVNSNYGWQWNRNSQLSKVVQQLTDNPETRRAWISIYDGKEQDQYAHDTPCTIGIGFSIRYGEFLDMSVIMRSNDLWYGFCNDQYCFSMLQEATAQDLGLEVGTYYHWAHNFHLYEDQMLPMHDGAWIDSLNSQRIVAVDEVGTKAIYEKV